MSRRQPAGIITIRLRLVQQALAMDAVLDRHALIVTPLNANGTVIKSASQQLQNGYGRTFALKDVDARDC
jgi:hypothetical protein